MTLPSNGFQDRLVMTASISLRILFCCAAFRAVGFGKRRRGTPDPALSQLKVYHRFRVLSRIFCPPAHCRRCGGFRFPIERMGDFREACAGQRGRFFSCRLTRSPCRRVKNPPCCAAGGIPDKLFLSFHCLPDRGHITP